MKWLSKKEIEKFAGRDGVKRIAVENFLMTLHPDAGEAGNLYNLKSDTKSYKWNAKTVTAIRAGIRLAFIENRNAALADFVVHG